MSTTDLGAWHGDAQFKAATLEQMAAHVAADHLIHGIYWDPRRGRGCLIGCLTHNPEGGHEQFPELFGIPAWLAHLADDLFEMQARGVDADWALRFLRSIAPGADLSRVWLAVAERLMLDPVYGNITRCAGVPAVEAAVRAVGELAAGPEASDAEWAAAAESAWLAVDAARTATGIACPAADAARSAAWAAEASRTVNRFALSYEAAARAAERATESAASAADWAKPYYRWLAEVLVDALTAQPAIA